MIFDYEYVSSYETLLNQIKKCEGNHVQQVVFSTYHNALTQICFDCKKVRTMIKKEDD